MNKNITDSANETIFSRFLHHASKVNNFFFSTKLHTCSTQPVAINMAPVGNTSWHAITLKLFDMMKPPETSGETKQPWPKVRKRGRPEDQCFQPSRWININFKLGLVFKKKDRLHQTVFPSTLHPLVFCSLYIATYQQTTSKLLSLASWQVLHLVVVLTRLVVLVIGLNVKVFDICHSKNFDNN